MSRTVSVPVKFKVICDDETFDHMNAREAASQAVFDHLGLTNNNIGVVEEVTVHVDGLGNCRVSLDEDGE